MTERERILAVYRGEVPDRIPFFLDLSHYYLAKYQKPWDLLNGYPAVDEDEIAYHRRFQAGYYIPNQMIQFKVGYADNVRSRTWKETCNGVPEIHWRLETAHGAIERVRSWEPMSYSWPIKAWGVQTEDDLRVLGEALAARRFEPLVDNYRAWDACVGDMGIVSLLPGYSAMGHILHYWMGMENAMYACVDWNDTMHEVVDRINANIITCAQMLATRYPGPVILAGDNFSSDCQPPSFFEEWSAPFYRELADIAHENGKKLSVHVDGRLRKSIAMIGGIGADIIDAVTPMPTGDLTPQECRDEAGRKLILSGGVPPLLWLPQTPVEEFEKFVLEWLSLRKQSTALVAAAGDQVPPGADEARIDLMRDLVNTYGRY